MKRKKDRNKRIFLTWKNIGYVITGILIPLLAIYSPYIIKIITKNNDCIIIKEITNPALSTDNKKEIIKTFATNNRENAITCLILLLNRNDKEIRDTAASELQRIGKKHGEKCVKALHDFLLDETVYAKYKLEAFQALKEINNDSTIKTAKEIVQKIADESIQKRESKNPADHIDLGTDSFITKEMLHEFYQCSIPLENLYLPGMDFSNQELPGVKLNCSYLKNAIFCGTNLTGAFFNGADLQEADFDGATITNAHFVNAKFKKKKDKKSVFSGCTGVEDAEFSSSDFSENEFKDPLTIERLCQVINNANDNLPLKEKGNTRIWLNELLKVPNFYNIVNNSDKRRVSQNIDIQDLVEDTKDYREGDFSDLDAYQKYTIMRLNRLLLEAIYETQTPKLPVSQNSACE